MKTQMGWPMGDCLCIFPCDVKRQIKNQYDEKSLIGRSDSNFLHQSVRQMSIGPFVGPSVKQVGIGSFIGPSVKQVRINNTLYWSKWESKCHWPQVLRFGMWKSTKRTSMMKKTWLIWKKSINFLLKNHFKFNNFCSTIHSSSWKLSNGTKSIVRGPTIEKA